MNKITTLIAAGAAAALALGTTACGSAGSGSTTTPNLSQAVAPAAVNQPAVPSGGCSVVDVTDDVAVSATGSGQDALCRYFTDGQFTGQVGDEISAVGTIDGAWVAGSVPAGSAVACSTPYDDSTVTVYDTTGQVPGFSPINSMCDDFEDSGD
jgi:hypothetical protein